MNSDSRQAALDRIRAGDARELGELLDSFRAYLAVIARARRSGKLAGKVEESDLVQDSLLTAHRQFADFRGKTVEEDESSGARLRQEAMRQLLSLPYHEAKDRVLESFEKTYLLEHLKAANGVVTRAAQRAGLPRQSVHRMLRRLGISANEEP